MPPVERERESLLDGLRATRDAFLTGCSGITDLQGKFKPAPDRWSIEECAEHIALVENGALARLTQEATPAERVVRPERQAELRERLGIEARSGKPLTVPALPAGSALSRARSNSLPQIAKRQLPMSAPARPIFTQAASHILLAR
jgi:hypothetical protein